MQGPYTLLLQHKIVPDIVSQASYLRSAASLLKPVMGFQPVNPYEDFMHAMELAANKNEQ
jgi:hypothetical protein